MIKSSAISGGVSPLDIEFLKKIAAGCSWTGESENIFILFRLQNEGNFDVTLDTLKCQTFTISPIRVYNSTIHFAPIGLVDIYNSGGATKDIRWASRSSGYKVRGCGQFGAYSSAKPIYCLVDMKEEEEFVYNEEDEHIFVYNEVDGVLIVNLGGEYSVKDEHICY
ncbi:hypothetical protein LguiA_009421 [Lonicera macranthoides]